MPSKFNIGVSLNPRQALKGLTKIRSAFGGVGTEAKRSGSLIKRTMDNSSKAIEQTAGNTRKLASAMSGLRGSVAAVAAIAASTMSIFETGAKMEAWRNSLSVVTDSAKNAADTIKWLKANAQELGISFEGSVESFQKLAAAAKNTSLKGSELRRTFRAVSGAARVLGLDGEDLRLIMFALTQMISKGKVSSEELRRQMGERFPGAMQIAARAIGKTDDEFEKMLKTGSIIAEDFMPKFTDQIEKEFGPAMASAATQPLAAVDRLKNAWFDLKVTIADAGFMRLVADAMEGIASAMRKITPLINEFERLVKFAWKGSNLEKFWKGLKENSDGVLDGLKEKFWEVIKLIHVAFGRIGTASKELFTKLELHINKLKMSMLDFLSQLPGVTSAALGFDDSKYVGFKSTLMAANGQLYKSLGLIDEQNSKLTKNASDWVANARKTMTADELRTSNAERDHDTYLHLWNDQFQAVARLDGKLKKLKPSPTFQSDLQKIKDEFDQIKEKANIDSASLFGDGLVIGPMGGASEQAFASMMKLIEKADEFKLKIGEITEYGVAFGDKWAEMAEQFGTPMQRIGEQVAEIFGPGGTFSKGVGDAVASSILQMNSFKDSIKAVGRAIIHEVISNLVQIGVQMAMNYAKQQILGTATVAATTAAGVAGAAASAAAWAPAAAMASLASFGANAAPAMTGISSTVGLAKALSLPMAEKGGPISGPTLVGEAGPEIFVPKGAGTVIPNDKLGGGGDTVNVSFNINANDSRGFDQLLQTRRGMIVNMVNQAMNDRGRTGVTS